MRNWPLSRKLLLVEDNPAILLSLERIADELGCEFQSTNGIAAARSALQQQEFDIVLLDLHLPDGDSYEFTRELHRLQDKNAPTCIALFHPTYHHEENKLLHAGFSACIAKPIDPLTTRAVLQQFLHDSASMPAQHGHEFGKKRRVLLVDDDSISGKLAAFHLRKLGFVVEQVDCAKAALVIARENPPDLIVADVLMPQFDGFQLAREVSGDPQLMGIPVFLITSAYTSPQDIDLASRCGAQAIVDRTHGLAELTEVLDAWSANRHQSIAANIESERSSEAIRLQRVEAQLARQIALNQSLTRQSSLLSAQLAVLSGIATLIANGEDLRESLSNVIVASFDTSAIEGAILYHEDPCGRLQAMRLGELGWTSTQMQSFCGRTDLLYEALENQRPRLLPSSCLSELNCAATQGEQASPNPSALTLAPFRSGDHLAGVLVIVSHAQLGSTDHWLTYCQALASQVAQTLRIQRAFSEVDRQKTRAQAHAQLLQTTLDSLADPVIVASSSGTIELANRAARSMVDLADASPISRWTDLFATQRSGSETPSACPLQRALAGESVENLELFVARPTGLPSFFLASARPVPACGALHASAVAVYRDVSTQQQARAELEQSHAAFACLIAHAPDHILRLKADGTIVFSNASPSYLQRKDLVGCNIVELVPANQQETLRKLMKTCAAKRETQTLEFGAMRGEENSNGDGCWTGLVFAPLAEPTGDHAGTNSDRGDLVVFVRDLTLQKKSETELVTNERLDCFSGLAAGISHAINNPLAAAIINLELASRDAQQITSFYPLPQEFLDELADAREECERIRTIASDLRILSKQNGETNAVVDVQRVLRSAIRLCSNELRHRARIVHRLEETPWVVASELRLGQAFVALFLTIARSLPESGVHYHEIEISSTSDQSNEVVIAMEIRGRHAGSVFQAAPSHSRFIDMSQTGDTSVLCLSICRRVVGEIGGCIDISHESSDRTRMTIHLPGRANTPIHALSVATTPDTNSRRSQILIVDDDVMVARSIRRILSTHHEVVGVDDAKLALQMLEEGQRYDVILCDLMMPQISGAELFAEIQRIDPYQSRRVAFLTGGAFTPQCSRFLAEVDNPRLAKPFDVASLHGLVESMLA